VRSRRRPGGRDGTGPQRGPVRAAPSVCRHASRLLSG
jgi:hypothetical protein